MDAQEGAGVSPNARRSGNRLATVPGNGEGKAVAGRPGEESPVAPTVTEFVQKRFDSMARSTMSAFRALSGQDAVLGAGGGGAQFRAPPGPAQAPIASLSGGAESRATASAVARADSSGAAAGPLSGVAGSRHGGDGESAALSAVRAWLLQQQGQRTAAEAARRRREQEQEERRARESGQRLEMVRAKVRGALAVLARFHRLGLPATSWKNKMPYREPRAAFLARGLKWPEDQQFESEDEKRRYLRYIRKVQPFLYGDIPDWSWIAADIGLFVFLTINPRWPWTLD